MYTIHERLCLHDTIQCHKIQAEYAYIERILLRLQAKAYGEREKRNHDLFCLSKVGYLYPETNKETLGLQTNGGINEMTDIVQQISIFTFLIDIGTWAMERSTLGSNADSLSAQPLPPQQRAISGVIVTHLETPFDK